MEPTAPRDGFTGPEPPLRTGFEVRCSFEFGDDFTAKDVIVRRAAGRTGDHSGAGMGFRDHGWYVSVFQVALAMKRRIEKALPGATVTIKER